jgi:hypothetical protein
MVIVTMQRDSARRVVAIALFVLIALVFAALAFLVPPDGQNQAAFTPAPEATLTPLRQASVKGASGDAATPQTSRSERVEHGSR